MKRTFKPDEAKSISLDISTIFPGFSTLIDLLDAPDELLTQSILGIYQRATGIPCESLEGVEYDNGFIRVAGQIYPLPSTDFYLIGGTNIRQTRFIDSFTANQLVEAYFAMQRLRESLRQSGSDSPLAR